MAALPVGQHLSVTNFPAGPTRYVTVNFRRVEIFAPGAVIHVIGADGQHDLPQTKLVFLRGYSADGSSRVAMSLNADGSFHSGSGEGQDGAFALHADPASGNASLLVARSLESTLPSADAFVSSCGNEQIELRASGSAQGADLAGKLHRAISYAGAAPQATQGYNTAIIAIDTDSLFMSRLFSNNTTNATNWIAGMFNSMNTMYEADLNVQLLIGDTTLRTSSVGDPYAGFGGSGVGTADLNVFGSYWRTNKAAVPRSFAALLSGAISSTPNSCSAAGIAWLDLYCQKGFVSDNNTYGSYSVNKVCTSINIDPNGTFNARLVGHEIGHNFGANHTHCTDVGSGNAPVATNTIDACYNGEGATHTTNGDCYDGATSCPTGGAGTIMSYCNISGCGTQNLMKFHSTHINDVLLPEIAAHTPSCLASGNDIIFQNGFQ